MKTIRVVKADKTIKGTVRLPASKSISNRLLILQALAKQPFFISNLSQSDDTCLLEHLLTEIEKARPNRPYTELDTTNAGTVFRFLTAYLAIRNGRWILTGSDRMKLRPVGELVDALRSLGGEIEFLRWLGYPPILIVGKPLKGGEITMDAGISSQFISALLLLAPFLENGLIINLKGKPVSFPYIRMTLRILNHFGVETTLERTRVIVRESSVNPADFSVEADWSSAAFWYEAAALADEVDLFLQGLQFESLQGDSILASIFRNFGVITEYKKDGVHLKKTSQRLDGYYFDFSDYPDIAPPVITTCAALGLRGRFEGLKSLMIKETDRLYALKNEYKKLGMQVDTNSTNDLISSIEFHPSKLKAASDLKIDTYGDHRMAMTFAPLAIKFGSIQIENPDVVSKSYPDFWNQMKSVGYQIC